MSVDPYMERVQRRVLDDAGHPEIPVEWFTIAEPSKWGDRRMPLTNPTPIYDALILEQFAVSSPCPSLWQRTPEWAIWLGTAILVLALLALPVIA